MRPLALHVGRASPLRRNGGVPFPHTPPGAAQFPPAPERLLGSLFFGRAHVECLEVIAALGGRGRLRIIRGGGLGSHQLYARRANRVDGGPDERLDQIRQQLIRDGGRGVDLAQPDAQFRVDEEVVPIELERLVILAV